MSTRLSCAAQVLLSGKVAKLASVVAVAPLSATVRLTGSGKVVPDVHSSRLTHVDDADPDAVRAARRNAAEGAAAVQRRLLDADRPELQPFQMAIRAGDEVGCVDSRGCKHRGTSADPSGLSWVAQVLLSGRAVKLANVVAVALPFATVRLTGSQKVVPDVHASRLTPVDDADPGAVSAARQNAARTRRRLPNSTTTVFQISEEVRPRSNCRTPLPRNLGPRSALTRPAPLTPGSPRGRARFVARARGRRLRRRSGRVCGRRDAARRAALRARHDVVRRPRQPPPQRGLSAGRHAAPGSTGRGRRVAQANGGGACRAFVGAAASTSGPRRHGSCRSDAQHQHARAVCRLLLFCARGSHGPCDCQRETEPTMARQAEGERQRARAAAVSRRRVFDADSHSFLFGWQVTASMNLHPELRAQYDVGAGDATDANVHPEWRQMLLFPCSAYESGTDEWSVDVCTSCKTSLDGTTEHAPKNSIANGNYRGFASKTEGLADVPEQVSECRSCAIRLGFSFRASAGAHQHRPLMRGHVETELRFAHA